MIYENLLDKLESSNFRNSFNLDKEHRDFVNDKGISEIRNHAVKFLNERIRTSPENDGSQTPYKGHPVFVAQHATATCCRKCIEKWYKIPKNKILNDEEVMFFAGLIVAWIVRHSDFSLQ